MIPNGYIKQHWDVSSKYNADSIKKKMAQYAHIIQHVRNLFVLDVDVFIQIHIVIFRKFLAKNWISEMNNLNYCGKRQLWLT